MPFKKDPPKGWVPPGNNADKPGKKWLNKKEAMKYLDVARTTFGIYEKEYGPAVQ